jgi:GTP-binding protein
MREFDEQMLDWCHHNHTPVHILLTKADKLSKGAASSVMHKIKKWLKDENFDKASVQTFSSLKRTGAETVIAKMDEWFEYEPREK